MIDVQRVTFNYFESPNGLRDVSFRVDAGERVVVLGRNGCGKSTLLSLLAGQHCADEGTIRVLGKDAFRDTSLNNDVTLVGPPWPPEAYFGNTVDNVCSPAPDIAVRDAIARTLHLPLKAWVDKMSSGEKRRVQLLYGLMFHTRRIFLLDECSTDLDLVERRSMLALIRMRCEGGRGHHVDSAPPAAPLSNAASAAGGAKGGCCVYATHIMDGLQQWATRVLLMEDGRVMRDLPIGDLVSAASGSPQRTLPTGLLPTGGLPSTAVEVFARGCWTETRTLEGADALMYEAYSLLRRSPGGGEDATAGPGMSHAQQGMPAGTVGRPAPPSAAAIGGKLHLPAPLSETLPAVSVRNFHLDAILRGVNVALPAGSRCLLLGSNGSGKSTLLEVLAGKRFYAATGAAPAGWSRRSHDDATSSPSDEATKATALISKNAAPSHARLQGRVCYHDTKLNDVVTLGGSWWPKAPAGQMHVGELLHPPLTQRAEHLRSLLRVDLRWDLRHVSSGELKRIQLLLRLQEWYPIVLLDEATADLDLDMRQILLAFLREESEQSGVTVLYATHIFEGLAGWATHACIMDRSSGQAVTPARFVSERLVSTLASCSANQTKDDLSDVSVGVCTCEETLSAAGDKTPHEAAAGGSPSAHGFLGQLMHTIVRLKSDEAFSL